MADITMQKFVCPKCGKELELEMMRNMEIPYDNDMKEKFMANDYFTMHCKNCNTVLPIGYRSNYNDLEKRYLLWLLSKNKEADEKEVAAYNEKLKTDDALRLARNGYRFRLVSNSNDLREKILIFDADLDDRVIELMKLAYVPTIRKQVGTDTRIVGFYFDWRIDGQGGQWLIIFDNRKPMVAKFEMSMYEDIQKKWQEALDAHTGEGLIMIDPKWAVEVMQSGVAPTGE